MCRAVMKGACAGRIAVGAGLLAGVLGGCAIGPDYHRPDMAVPAAFKEAAGWKLAAPNDAVLRGRWWHPRRSRRFARQVA